MPKFVDAFIFYNEQSMLLFRLTELYESVDYFIIVEATHTFSGSKKPLYYNKNKEKYSKFHSKIIHLIVDDMPNTQNPWDNERHQRNSISKALNNLKLADDDIIMISDCDEIPNSQIIREKKMNGIQNIYSLKMELYYYTFEWYVQGDWTHAKILPYKIYKASHMSIDDLRLKKQTLVIDKGGWHLSYFGNETQIQNKIRDFSHQEFNHATFTDISAITLRMENGIDVFDRKNVKLHNIPLNKNVFLPKNYEMLLI